MSPRASASIIFVVALPPSVTMSHEVNRYEWEQMRANLAAKDAEIRELHGVLNGTALRLESETTELRGWVEMERIRRRQAEPIFANLHAEHYGGVVSL